MACSMRSSRASNRATLESGKSFRRRDDRTFATAIATIDMEMVMPIVPAMIMRTISSGMDPPMPGIGRVSQKLRFRAVGGVNEWQVNGLAKDGHRSQLETGDQRSATSQAATSYQPSATPHVHDHRRSAPGKPELRAAGVVQTAGSCARRVRVRKGRRRL